jgi:hypothetical protein
MRSYPIIPLMINLALFSCQTEEAEETQATQATTVSINTYAEFQSAVADKAFDHIAACCELSEEQKLAISVLFSSLSESDSSVDVIAEGWATFDASKANACLDIFNTISCSDDFKSVIDIRGAEACAQILTPKQSENMPCGKTVSIENGSTTSYYEETCLSGLACAQLADDADPVCTPQLAIGADCSGKEDACIDGSSCDFSTSTCVADEEEAGSQGLDDAACAQIKMAFGK